MRKARVRLEAKKLPSNASISDRVRVIIGMQRAFKKMCDAYGIPQMYKEHECFIRKCDIRRRKRMAKKHAAQNELNKNVEEEREYLNNG